MTDGDDKLSRRYRDLAREEPPASLDAAILSASRRAVAKPSFTRRWGVPVSIAAVLVLGFGLTLEMQHEKPDVSTSPSTMQSTMPSALPPASAPMQAPEAEAPAPAREQERSVAKPEVLRAPPEPLAKKKTANAATIATPPPPSFAVPPPSRPATIQMQNMPAPATPPPPPDVAADRMDRSPAAPAAAAAPAARAKSAIGAGELRTSPAPALTVEQELQRIAELRDEGDDAQADGLLEKFRREHPGYTIPAAMWERVKPR